MVVPCIIQYDSCSDDTACDDNNKYCDGMYCKNKKPIFYFCSSDDECKDGSCDTPTHSNYRRLNKGESSSSGDGNYGGGYSSGDCTYGGGDCCGNVKCGGGYGGGNGEYGLCSGDGNYGGGYGTGNGNYGGGYGTVVMAAAGVVTVGVMAAAVAEVITVGVITERNA